MPSRKRTAQYVFTGKPCKNGHIGPRYKSGTCVECLLAKEAMKYANPEFAAQKKRREIDRRNSNIDEHLKRSRKYHAENRTELNEKSRQCYLDNRDVRLEEVRQYREKYPDRVKASQRKYHERNREKRRQSHREWKAKNSEYVIEKNRINSKIHYARDPSYYLHKRKMREAKKLMAIPSWANLDKIKDIYKEARRLSIETGIQMSVDHIIALHATDERGNHVACGLHCEDNLQIVTLEYNKKKGSRIV